MQQQRISSISGSAASVHQLHASDGISAHIYQFRSYQPTYINTTRHAQTPPDMLQTPPDMLQTSMCKHKNLHSPNSCRDTIRHFSRLGQSLPELVQSCAFTLFREGVIIKATQGQVILRGGTTQSRASEALSSASRGASGKGTPAPSWFLPRSKTQNGLQKYCLFSCPAFPVKDIQR